MAKKGTCVRPTRCLWGEYRDYLHILGLILSKLIELSYTSAILGHELKNSSDLDDAFFSGADICIKVFSVTGDR